MQRQADNECSEERAEQRGGEVCEAGGEVDEAGGEVGEAGRRMKCREREGESRWLHDPHFIKIQS